MYKAEGCSIDDEPKLLVEAFKGGQSQFFIGRSIDSMRPATPSFLSRNIIYFNKKFPGQRFYARQITVDSLFTPPPEDSGLPKQVDIDLRRMLNSKPMDFPGAGPWKELMEQQPILPPADLDSHEQKS